MHRVIFFIGWLLSPLTFWNDPFLNIPLSYLSAAVFIRFFRADFPLTVLVFYWLSNAAGLVMMFISGRKIVEGKKDILRESLVFVAAIALYSALLYLLAKLGILKPF